MTYGEIIRPHEIVPRAKARLESAQEAYAEVHAALVPIAKRRGDGGLAAELLVIARGRLREAERAYEEALFLEGPRQDAADFARKKFGFS
jgi:hypothetical protein